MYIMLGSMYVTMSISTGLYPNLDYRTQINYITLHYITLHYITLHYIRKEFFHNSALLNLLVPELFFFNFSTFCI